MMKTNILLMLCGLCVTSIANAECPSSMNKDELMKCQSIEKSGANYQEWQKEMAGDSTISPITGQDVRTVAPAAGKETAGSKATK